VWSVLDAEVARSWQAAAIAVAGGVLVIASAVAFTYLGVTQTNRHKPGVVRMEHEHGLGDVFVGDPGRRGPVRQAVGAGHPVPTAFDGTLAPGRHEGLIRSR